MLIGVVGLNGSGKDTLAKYISQKHDFEWISISNLVRDECIKQGLSINNRDNLRLIAEKLRSEYGPDIWVKKALKNYSPKKNFILSSFRHPLEITFIKNKNGKIILVDVPLKIRFKRTKERVKKNPLDHGDTNFNDFVKKEERELVNIDKNKMQLGECTKMFDYKIDNSKDLDSLKKNTDILLKKILNKN